MCEIQAIGNYTIQPAQLVDNNGIVNLIWEQGGGASDIYYARRELNNNWSEPFDISQTDESSTNAQMVMDSAGVLHIVWLESEWTHAKIYYAYRSTDGNWSNSQMLFDYNFGYQGQDEIEPLQLLSASNGKVYLLWSYSGRIYCTTRLPNQNWSSPEIVYGPNMYFRNPRAAVDLNGTIHVTMYTRDQNGSEGITYMQRDDTAVWSYPIYLTTDFQGNYDNTGNRYTFVDRYGRVQVLWVDVRDSDMYYVIKSANGEWSEPVNISEGWLNWDGFNNTKAVKADEEGRIFLAWSGGGINISQHAVYSDWSTPIYISTDTYTTNPISLFPDSHGNIHVTWDMPVYCGSNECGNIYYTVQKPGEAWTDPIVLSQPDTRVFSPNIAVGLDGRVHVVWIEYELNDVWIDYVGPVSVPYSGKSILSQELTIPATITSPTLSFFYQLEDASDTWGSGFSLFVNNGITTTLLSTSANTSDWTHAWFDLSPWLSQTITLTFNVHETEGYPYTWAYVDEVTIGSAHPDVWVSALGAPAVMPGKKVTLQLSYGNRSPAADAISATITATLPAGLIFESASITPTVNGNVLTWSVGDLPAGSGPFTILVTVTVASDAAPGSTLTIPVEIATATPEIELVNNLEEYTLYIGSFVYLPITVR
jgi:hypothetical protein